MSSNNSSKDIEELFQHSIELNKRYLNQGFKLLKKMGNQGTLDKNMFTFQPDLYKKAFNTFTKMNLEYYNKVMDFGFSMAEQVLSDQVEADEHEVAPSFTLEGTGPPGSRVELQFVLENVKDEPVICTLDNSVFQTQEQVEEADLNAVFKPQSFPQEPGEATRVEIVVSVGKSVVPGTYLSNVRVLGFEPSYFEMIINVEPAKKPKKNVRAKKKSKK